MKRRIRWENKNFDDMGTLSFLKPWKVQALIAFLSKRKGENEIGNLKKLSQSEQSGGNVWKKTPDRGAPARTPDQLNLKLMFVSHILPPSNLETKIHPGSDKSILGETDKWYLWPTVLQLDHIQNTMTKAWSKVVLFPTQLVKLNPFKIFFYTIIPLYCTLHPICRTFNVVSSSCAD